MARVSVFFALVLIAGCAKPEKAALPNNTYLRGNAKIISIEPENGHAILQYDGRQIDAYWQTEVYLAQGGGVSAE